MLHYQIVEQLGAGGMGIVWKAIDTQLGREVALKFLPDTATADPVRLERLVREARAASALNHPNIVTIYDIQSGGDTPFIAMELIHGRSLSELLRGAHPFPVREAVGYMIQFCDGLAKAHAARIVHRDIKPSNVMLTEDGLIKILDFGLAKTLAESSSFETTHAASVPLTVEGVVMGTIPYMSPEQAAGEVVGARSDIFSTGIVLYEMLAGSRPFDGASKAAVMEAVLRADPVPLRTVAPGVPEELAEIVHTCLRKAPEARYANAGELAVHLRAFERHSSAAYSSKVQTATAMASPRATRIHWNRIALAVGLLSATGAGVYFGTVRSGDSVAAVNAIAPGTLTSAQALLQRYDLTGNIDRAIALLQPAVQRDSSNAALHAALAEAYLLKYSAVRDRTWLQKASGSAHQAVAENTDLAAAHVALGRTLAENGQNDQAATELQRAIELDPLSSRAHVALANVRFAQRQIAEAGELYDKAVRFSAADDWVPLASVGVFYLRTAKYGDAIAALQKALSLSPGNVSILRNLGPGYFLNGQFAEAAGTFQRALESDSTIVSTWANLGTARYFQGDYAKAVTALEKAVSLAPKNYLYWGNLGDAYRWAPGLRNKATDAYAHAIQLARDQLALNLKDTSVSSSLAVYLAKSGDTPTALAEVATIERTPANSPDTLVKAAIVYELASDRARALDALGRALRAGYSRVQIENEPELAMLREDPGYPVIVRARVPAAR